MITLPIGYTCVQPPVCVGHAMPSGALVTAPVPPPATVTVSVAVMPAAICRAKTCGTETPRASQATNGPAVLAGSMAMAGVPPSTPGPLMPVVEAEPAVSSTHVVTVLVLPVPRPRRLT